MAHIHADKTQQVKKRCELISIEKKKVIYSREGHHSRDSKTVVKHLLLFILCVSGNKEGFSGLKLSSRDPSIYEVYIGTAETFLS